MQLAVGPRIPKGTLEAVSVDAVNADSKYYPEPFTFDGYRFLRMREAANEQFKHRHVPTSANELNFGFGGRACPGLAEIL
ncbi:hypothetical protein LTR28_005321 [Elasticomyces elasticus]|nr:hypothetical protein LTR28_005321 [Elasticomyces elasticus]